MRKLFSIFVGICLPFLLFAQLKESSKLPSFSQIGSRPNSNFILGFLNPDKLRMHHTFSMSYMSMSRSGGMMVNSYLNTIDYQISHPLFLRLNLGIANSPYNSFNHPALNNTQFFGGAELFYRFNDNSQIKVGFDVRPGFYGPYYYEPRFYRNGYEW